jgi:4-hydroxy-4-methyl-2-oxoglutarate aldolase
MSGQTPEAIVAALDTLDTSHVSDALDKLAINGQCAGLHPLIRDTRLTGIAFTVRYVPVGTDGGSVGDYIDDLDPGTVVVIDNAGRTDTTVWGDLLTATAARRDLAGTVIDGTCRDTDRAVDLRYPVYSAHRWMRTGKDRVRVDGYNVPVSIGGVRVEQGDYLLGDADGVVTIPRARAEEILDVARGISAAEEGIRELVDTGCSLAEARERYGYHRLQAAEGRTS